MGNLANQVAVGSWGFPALAVVSWSMVGAIFVASVRASAMCDRAILIRVGTFPSPRTVILRGTFVTRTVCHSIPFSTVASVPNQLVILGIRASRACPAS